jgi:hypothetical protein
MVGEGDKEENRLPVKEKQDSSLPSQQIMFLICKQYVNCKKSFTERSKMTFAASILFSKRKEGVL